MTHSAAHYPLSLGAAGVFYENAALIEGLRFMSCILDIITCTIWPQVHFSFCLTILASSLPFDLQLSTLSPPLHHPPHVILPHVPSLFPHTHRARRLCRPYLALFSLSSVSFLFLHLSFCAQQETSGTGGCRILISQFVVVEGCQTGFPINL